MTLLFDKPRTIISPSLAPEMPGERIAAMSADDAVLDIGLVNNMPDAAMLSTERQFIRLLDAAAGKRLVRLHFFSLSDVPRSAATKLRMASTYDTIDALGRTHLDGLIVTGAEPRASSLANEPYWRALTSVIDWAEANTLSTIWSCLAAHAAVLHLDGIERKRLDTKCSGIFDCQTLADEGLVSHADAPPRVAHSRLNGLSEGELSRHGYRVLTRSTDAGVDIFSKQWRSLFVFFQGHPEYDAHSLQLEYLRDIGRYLAGDRDSYPQIPSCYFDQASEHRLSAFREKAMTHRTPSLIAERPELSLRAGVAEQTAHSASILFCNWLNLLCIRKNLDAFASTARMPR